MPNAKAAEAAAALKERQEAAANGAEDVGQDAETPAITEDAPQGDTTPPPPEQPEVPSPPPKAVPVDEAKVASDVAALPKGVFDGVPNATMKGLLRDAVQAMRQGIAVGRATGMLPRRALSIVVVIDEELDGRAQVFAGDRTVQ